MVVYETPNKKNNMEALWGRGHRDRCCCCDSTDVVEHLRAYKRVMNGVRVALGKKKRTYTLHKELEQMITKFEKMVEQLYCHECDSRGKTPCFYEDYDGSILCTCGNPAAARPTHKQID